MTDAADTANTDIASKLIESGADINGTVNGTETPLSYALARDTQEADLKKAIERVNGYVETSSTVASIFNDVVARQDALRKKAASARLSTSHELPQPALPAIKDEERSPLRRKAKLKPGVQMDDETLYAGVSPENGKLIFTTPQDIKGPDGENEIMTLEEAKARVDRLNAENAFGHNDWHIATSAEMGVLIDGRKAGKLKNSFNLTCAEKVAVQLDERGTVGWYWTSDLDKFDNNEYGGAHAWARQAFNNKTICFPVDERVSLRVVRTVDAGAKPSNKVMTTEKKKTAIAPTGNNTAKKTALIAAGGVAAAVVFHPLVIPALPAVGAFYASKALKNKKGLAQREEEPIRPDQVTDDGSIDVGMLPMAGSLTNQIDAVRAANGIGKQAEPAVGKGISL